MSIIHSNSTGAQYMDTESFIVTTRERDSPYYTSHFCFTFKVPNGYIPTEWWKIRPELKYVCNDFGTLVRIY